MSKFFYRMQNILDIKMKLEEQAKNEYAIAQAKLNEEEERRDRLIFRQGVYEQKARELAEDVLDVPVILENGNAINVMKHLVADQQIVVKRAEDFLEKRRVRLQEVMTERKTHDKLKEKAFEAFMQEENARESKEIDELTSYTYGKK
ncbi:flagellar export protein FliJ [bacterium C-53]|nr:flagellar export protein FliJ [Lachnospiraceae bacterium]NBI02112.1 flagellar export protein FliJ [Lachnospiraceae bacterium]RKJ10373.1 flagellar export protein FliJ [bacterium C-53]